MCASKIWEVVVGRSTIKFAFRHFFLWGGERDNAEKGVRRKQHFSLFSRSLSLSSYSKSASQKKDFFAFSFSLSFSHFFFDKKDVWSRGGRILRHLRKRREGCPKKKVGGLLQSLRKCCRVCLCFSFLQRRGEGLENEAKGPQEGRGN